MQAVAENSENGDQLLSGGATAHESRTQTTEAKLVAVFTAAEAAQCLRFVPQELGFP